MQGKSGQWSVASGQCASGDTPFSSSLATSHQPLATTPSASSPTTNHQPPTTSRRRRRRRAITLTEVLISMGVLLVGLMSIGALLPAGRYEILQGVKADYATTVGRSAFRDLKARGYLNPANWRDNVTGAPGIIPPTTIDPLAPASFTAIFPFGATAPLALARCHPFGNLPVGTNTQLLADPIFRCQDDSTTTPDTRGRDRPPFQQTVPFNNEPWAPVMLPIAKRGSEGNYSWLATIVPDPTVPVVSIASSKMIVSVAVLYKRSMVASAMGPPGEATATVTFMPGGGIGGGEVTLSYPAPALTKFPRGLRPGQWIMLAGSLPPAGLNYFRWYRVAAASPIDASTGPTLQNVTLAGADWIPAAFTSTPPTTAFLFGNVIAVYEKNMQLE